MIIVVLIVFFCLQGFVLFCCLAAGDDPGSQEVSDQEQMKCGWRKERGKPDDFPLDNY